MAFVKQTEMHGGVQANFWVIQSLIANFETQTATVFLKLYLTKAAKVGGKGFLDIRQFTIPLDMPITRPKIEAAIKALPDFSGATDDTDS